MDEQTGSPGANAENNGQRNGDEVRAEDGCQITYFSGFPIQTPKNVLPAYISWGIATWTFRTYLFLLSCTEAPTWQLDQGEEEEEANEGQQCTKGPSHRLRSLYEWQTGAATGRTSRRALSRDYEDAGQRVEQAAPWGKAGWSKKFLTGSHIEQQLWEKSANVLHFFPINYLCYAVKDCLHDALNSY